MRITKWIFIAYLVVTVLIIGGIAISATTAPPRDPYTLYTTYGANVKTLDPALIGDTVSSAIAGNIFECLYNYEFGVRPYKLMPELAREMPRVSADGRTVTIHIRRGVHFYDPEKVVFRDGVGPEVKAADFIYSWKRVASFNLASPMYSSIFQGRIVGLDEWWEYTRRTEARKIDWDRPVAGLQALDDYTIRITLTGPYPQLRYNLAHLPTAVVCRQMIEHYGDAAGKHPVGTGPYVLKEYLPEQRIVLVANPGYRGRPDIAGTVKLPAGERLPRIKRLQIDYFAEVLPAWMLFQQGLFDIAGIPKESYGQAINMQTGALTEQMKAKGVRLQKAVGPETFYIGFNMQDPIVGKNKALRQAMSMAFNRAEYIRIYLNGRGEPAIGPIPPGFPTFDAGATNPYTQFNLAGAREKMAEAERINGGPIPPLTLLEGSTDTSARQDADYFVQQMGQIGVRVNVEYTTWARFQDMIDHRQAQIFSLGWVADYPDEQTFLQLFYGKFAGAGGINPTAYKNPEYDALYERASVMEPGGERDELYRRMEGMVMEDCPWLIEFYPVTYTLYYDWVKNLHEMDYGYGMRQFVAMDVGERRGKRE